MILDLDGPARWYGPGTSPVQVAWSEGEPGWDRVDLRAVVVDGRPTDLEVRLLGMERYIPVEEVYGFDAIWEAGLRALNEAQARAREGGA